jgi:amino acid transporter
MADSAGTLAADVRRPEKVYLPAMIGASVGMTLIYLLPIAVGVCAEGVGDFTLWVDGYWTQVAAAVGGRWLGTWVTLAGAISCAGLLSTLLACTSRALAAMGRRGLMPAVLGLVHPRWGTPWVAILVMAAAVAALMLADFETLAEANMLTYNLKMVLEYGAVIKLRLAEPEMARPYRIRAGIGGLCLLFAPPVLCVHRMLPRTHTQPAQRAAR